MSDVQTVFDSIRSIVPTIASLSTWKELPIPEDLQKNNENILALGGWGIIVGDTSEFDSQELCFTMDSTTFSVVITRSSFNSNDNQDEAHKIKKELLGIAYDIRSRLTDSTELSIPSNLTILKYNGTSPVELIRADKYALRSMTINFSATTRQSQN